MNSLLFDYSISFFGYPLTLIIDFHILLLIKHDPTAKQLCLSIMCERAVIVTTMRSAFKKSAQ